METVSYPDMLRRFRRRFNEFNTLKTIINDLGSKEEFFQYSETCLSVGSGYGEYDIEFLRHFPKLKKLIVVEKNSMCVEELKINLKEAFGDLQVEIYEMPIERFMADEASSLIRGSIDVVVSFHCLYFMKSADRKEFFNLCFDLWLKPKRGKLVFLNPSSTNILRKLYAELEHCYSPFEDSLLMKEELESISAVILKDITYKCRLNVKEFDKDLFVIFAFSHKTSVSEKEVEEAFKKIAPDGYGEDDCHLIIAEK